MDEVAWFRVPLRFVLVLMLSVSSLTLTAKTETRRISVANRGVPGQNSDEGRKRFEQDVLRVSPQYVLIYFGMNDAVNEAKFLTEAQFVENIGWMVQAAREHRIVPVLATIQHVDAVRVLQRHKASVYGAEGPNGKIDRYNKALRNLAQQQNVPIADLPNALDAVGGATPAISTDGVHLTGAGYKLLASTFLHAILPAPQSGDAIVCLGDSLTYGVPLRSDDHDSDQTYPAQLERMLNRTSAK
jgi:acyl-CoA thioesterase-1